ncbi:hypothetical protein ACO0LM_15900 [Undibacterium sp. Di26W]|uniref:hypothetical protein n=1 Tax=Undibacterium sp. Di26W TaxID=3413035 RepID=UPI003BF3A77E
MGVHHLLYVVFPEGSQPNLANQNTYFERYGFKFLPSGFSYFLEKNTLRDKENENVVSSTEQLAKLPPEISNGLIQYWEGHGGVGFTIGFVQNNARIIGVIQFLNSEIELIHDYLRERNASLASFMYDYFSQMHAEVILGGSNEELLISSVITYINSDLLTSAKGVTFFVANDESKFMPGVENQRSTLLFIDGKTIYANWPFSEKLDCVHHPIMAGQLPGDSIFIP